MVKKTNIKQVDLKLMEHDLPHTIFLSVFKLSMFVKSEFYRKTFPHQLKKSVV